MAIHVVGFTNIIRYDGNDPVHHGRKLVEEYYDTTAYKALKPGDEETRGWNDCIVRQFVAPDPFVAELAISDKYTYGSPYVTLYDAKSDTFYPMFYVDFISMAKRNFIDHGKVSGRFGYVKKNKSFGIDFLGKDQG